MGRIVGGCREPTADLRPVQAGSGAQTTPTRCLGGGGGSPPPLAGDLGDGKGWCGVSEAKQ